MTLMLTQRFHWPKSQPYTKRYCEGSGLSLPAAAEIGKVVAAPAIPVGGIALDDLTFSHVQADLGVHSFTALINKKILVLAPSADIHFEGLCPEITDVR